MYFAMDEIGVDNLQTVLKYNQPSDRWKRIVDTAQSFGFSGVQLTSHFYEETLGLPLHHMPVEMSSFRLSYHIGGVRWLRTNEDLQEWSSLLAEGLQLANLHGMEDVSFHPPEFQGGEGRKDSRALLAELIDRWLPEYSRKGITLSLETHSDPRFFVFEGLSDYAAFVKELPGLGVLADISHCHFDGYSAEQVVDTLRGLKVTGLHLSDAISGIGFREGTHLAVGKGKVDFLPVLREYAKETGIYAALEVKGQAVDITVSLEALTEQLKVAKAES